MSISPFEICVRLNSNGLNVDFGSEKLPKEKAEDFCSIAANFGALQMDSQTRTVAVVAKTAWGSRRMPMQLTSGL